MLRHQITSPHLTKLRELQGLAVIILAVICLSKNAYHKAPLCCVTPRLLSCAFKLTGQHLVLFLK